MSQTHDETRYRASPKALVTEFGDGIAILHSDTNVYYSLDAVGATVWGALTGARTVTDLAEAVQAEFEVSEETCRADIRRLLDDMQTNDLVEPV